MAVPPDIVLKVRFDEDGFLSVVSRQRHLALVSNQDINLELNFEILDVTAVPPGFIAVDVTGWTVRWISKLDIDDLDAPASNIKWDVTGVIVGAPANGKIAFTVPKASVNFEVERGYSEFVIIIGGDTDSRIPLIFTLTKQVLTI